LNLPEADTRLTGFLRYLRHEGYTVGIQETLDTLDIMQAGHQPDKTLAHHILRSLACRSREEWQQFDQLFEQYWFPEHYVEKSTNVRVARLYRRNALAGLAGASEEEMYNSGKNAEMAASGAGRQKTISRADFRFLNDRKAARDIEKLAENLATVLKKKSRRRRQFTRHGRLLDIRRTLRHSMSFGGLPVKRYYSQRRQDPPHLVIIHDVSHSMAWNNPLLFRFVRGLMRTFPDSDAFAFHTELFCVSTLYRERSLKIMRERLEEKNHLWLGGTCIADSLETFNRTWARDILRRDSIVMILSDGFDTNDPECLERELFQLNKQAKKIVWLNPMLGREGFEFDETFLQHTRDHVDRFAPAHSLESLQHIVDYLSASG